MSTAKTCCGQRMRAAFRHVEGEIWYCKACGGSEPRISRVPGRKPPSVRKRRVFVDRKLANLIEKGDKLLGDTLEAKVDALLRAAVVERRACFPEQGAR